MANGQDQVTEEAVSEDFAPALLRPRRVESECL
jgi:hypothetical protein